MEMEYFKRKDFPENFLWGASSAAFQIEGASQEEGKSLNIMDVLKPLPGKCGTDTASDHYHRYKEDVALMKELGLKSYRFSISWARILPKGRGAVNEAGVAFYNHLIDELLDKGIEPIVTLYHFDMPVCLKEAYNGWADRRILKDFEEFCRVCFERFGDRITYWLTINEQSTILYYPKFCGSDVDEETEEKWKYKVSHNFTLGHAAAVKMCHEMLPKAKIGPAIGWNCAYPVSSRPEDVLAAENRNSIQGWAIMDTYVRGKYNALFWNYLTDRGIQPDVTEEDLQLMKEGKPDFIALNYYRTATVKACSITSRGTVYSFNKEGIKGTLSHPNLPGAYEETDNENLQTNDWDWAIDPIGLRITLRMIYDRYQLPLMITENGYGARDVLEADGSIHDDYRIDYLKGHLSAIKDAISDGVEMIAYNPWSVMDLVSSQNGFEKRYGFIYVDRTDEDLKNLERLKKDSFYWYQNVIRTNGKEL